MIRASVFALDPTPRQEQQFRSHCGAQRFAYNFGLALIRGNLDQRAAEHSYDTIVVEDLNVNGMLRTRRLARAISGLGMREFHRQIEYKAAEAGVHVVVADRWYPSSKTCSACDAVRTKLTLTEREFICQSCGTRRDRDLNAAMNLAALAAQALSGELRPEVKRPAGNPPKTALGGNGYCHGKTQTMSQRRPREVATP